MSGDAALALGGRQPSEGDAVEAVLFSSPDGMTWEPIERSRFRGLLGTAVARTDDLVFLFGSVFQDAGSIPTVLWSADIDTLRRARFPANATSDGTDIKGGAVTEDGTMAIAVGERGYRPAIWVSAISE